ncbi:Hint domain-containing protein [Roseovarius atlanticus]|nr:Hint domain-containing protein [Roseovarius atlanticus]MBY6123768.1 Hint domain-containing protein [Roseovarius atlanticus]MBY6148263.1 Hint domain-containing protein [Roseovarius atlanticus]
MEPKTVGGTGGTSPSGARVQASGFAAGAIVMTLDGEKAIEDLRPGDRVITRDTGMAVLRGVASATLRTRAIRVQAGSLGHTRPVRDVLLPAGQLLLIRDWRAEAMFGAKRAVAAVSRLVDGEFITDEGEVDMTLFTLEFDTPHVLYVDGLEVASTADIAALSKAA